MSESPGFQLTTPDPESHGSPLVSVWLEPGATITRIAASSPMRLFYPLAAVWGGSDNLSLAILAIVRDVPAEALNEAEITSAWVIVAINLIVGAVYGIVVLWVLSFLFAWLGRLLGGRARAREVRTVLAWSSVPDIPVVALAVVMLLLGGTAVLTDPHPTGTSVSSHPLQLIFLLAISVLGMWGSIISVAGMRAIMGINTLRAIAVYLFGWIIVVAIVTAVGLLAVIGFVQLTKV